MVIRTQLFIDRFIIYPIVFMLNFLVRLVGFILRMDHSLNKSFKGIAVCKFKGMGSILQATPLIETLRKHFPDSEIIFISTKQNKGIMDKIPSIDRTILINDSGVFQILFSFPVFISRIIFSRIGLYFDLEIYSNFSSIVTALSFAKNRIGYYLRSSNYRLGIYTHMMFFNVRIPISQVYLQLARLIGIKDIHSELVKLQTSSELINIPETGQYKLQGKDYFVINPNASDLRVERRWDAEKYVALIQRLREDFKDMDIFLIGSKSESKYVNNMYQHINNPQGIFDVSGKTNLDELIALIKYARIMITNDTGPMHIAYCTNTPTVSLFGPCLPDQYAIKTTSIAIHKNVYCSPCVHEFTIPPCKGNNVCMKLIKVEEVAEAVIELLKVKNQVNTPSSIIYRTPEEDTSYSLGYVVRRNTKIPPSFSNADEYK